MKHRANYLCGLLGLWCLIGAAPGEGRTVLPVDPSASISRDYSASHRAVDFVAPCGSPVYAARAGVVKSVVDHYTCRRCYRCDVGCRFSYQQGSCKNNEVVVEHAHGETTRYVHIRKSLVKEGQRVEAGALIAEVGNVGWACGNTGCHLHFVALDRAGASVKVGFETLSGVNRHAPRRGCW